MPDTSKMPCDIVYIMNLRFYMLSRDCICAKYLLIVLQPLRMGLSTIFTRVYPSPLLSLFRVCVDYKKMFHTSSARRPDLTGVHPSYATLVVLVTST